jgi:PAS domain S-box-containing protein
MKIQSYIQSFKSIPWPNLVGAFTILVFGLILTALLALKVKTDSEALQKQEFNFASDETAKRIEERLNTYAQILYGGAALFAASDHVSRQQWHMYAQNLSIVHQLPGIQGFGFSLWVPPARLAEHIQQIRAEGLLDYRVWPEGERENYTSILYLEPYSGRNLYAIGYDMFSEPVRRAAMERARDSNSAALSGKVVLVQETGQEDQAGSLLFVPVFQNGLPVETVAQRRAALLGWSYSPYRMDDLMNSILSGWVVHVGKTPHLEIFAGDQPTPDSLLYDSLHPGDYALPLDQGFTVLTPLDFAGQRWTLRFTQMSLSSQIDVDKQILRIYVGGTVISGQLFILMLHWLIGLVRASQAKQRIEAELHVSEDLLSAFLHYAPAYIFINDVTPTESRVLKVSANYQDISGIPPSEMIGKTKEDLYSLNLARKMSADDWAVITNQDVLFVEEEHNGRSYSGLKFPLYMGERTLVAGYSQDISERKRAEQAFAETSARLGLAVRAGGVGIWDYDIINNRLTWDEQMHCLYGTTSDVFGSAYSSWMKGVHPQDWARCDNEMRAAQRGETKGFDSEFRVLWPDGSIHHLYGLALVQRDASGNPLSMLGTNWDVTDKKLILDALQSSVAEKDALLREVHHRVKNNLAAIIGLISLQESRLVDPAIKGEFQEFSSRLSAMALVHQLLYNSESLTQIDMQMYLEALTVQLGHLYQSTGGTQLTVSAQGFFIDMDTAIPCGLIVSEAITNSFKYAFPSGQPRAGEQACKINVSASQVGSVYTLRVSDNGIGLPVGFDWKKSPTLGMKLIRMLGEHQLGASMGVDSSAGTCIQIQFTTGHRS